MAPPSADTAIDGSSTSGHRGPPRLTWGIAARSYGRQRLACAGARRLLKASPPKLAPTENQRPVGISEEGVANIPHATLTASLSVRATQPFISGRCWGQTAAAHCRLSTGVPQQWQPLGIRGVPLPPAMRTQSNSPPLPDFRTSGT